MRVSMRSIIAHNHDLTISASSTIQREKRRPAIMEPDTLAVPADSSSSHVDSNGAVGGADMRRASSTSSTYSHISDASSSGDVLRPTLSRASSLAYSDDGSVSTPSFRTNHSSASASMEGVDLLGTSGTAGALPLSDLFETYFSPRIDLAGRKWSAFSGDMKSRARRRREQLVRKARSKRELQQMDDELQKMRSRVSKRIENLQQKWMDAKVVRLRDKISFVVGVCNLVVSSLVFALRPELIPTLYSVLALYFLPLRVWSYTSRKWHYFLFDFCYFLNMANLLFIWVFPHSEFLFTVCYCAAHGPLAFSVATWRNSLVFHSLEKMTSLFIHLYPPFVFTTMVHFMPHDQAVTRFPALKNLTTLNGYTSFWFNVTIYLIWQLVYYELIVIRKKTKIEAGERINSYSTMSKGKGPVANLLGKAPPKRREPAFMLLQFVYTIITTLPAPLLLYPNRTASGVFFAGIFVVSVWNGASYYVEVFGRRFEKELVQLRGELEMIQAQEKVVAVGKKGEAKAEDFGREVEAEGEGEENEEQAAAAASGLPQGGEDKKDQ
ncbi:Glycerophosphocholine acyltransferase 1 [Pseudozyma hubeiensis]|nr:Glycerophosphocholine acyltransferase 1 [Pseudozyma hubeiensis]